MMVIRSLLGFSLALSCTAPAMAAECSLLSQHGLYDVTSSLDERTRSIAFRHWMCQSQFQSAQEAQNWSLTAGLPIGDLPVELGFDHSSQSWSEFMSEYCSERTYEETFQSRTETLVKIINPTLANALRDCLTQGGLHAALLQGASDRGFVFVARYEAIGPTRRARVRQFATSPNINCRSGPRRGDRIDIGGWESQCERTNNEAGTITFTADHVVVWDTPRTLASIFLPPEPPPQEVVSFEACDTSIQIGSSGNLHCGPIYGQVLRNNSDTAAHNWVEYRIKVSGPGAYELSVTYGAATESRPVNVRVNSTQIANGRLSAINGCWHDHCLTRGMIGSFRLRQGWNTVRVDGAGGRVFPHLGSFTFAPDVELRPLIRRGG
jgi:hypothetical protein